MPQRLAIVLGKYDQWYQARHKTNSLPRRDGNKSMFAQTKWQFLLFAPFDISNKCCNVMKKKPAHKYAKETGRKPITGQLAEESRLRKQQWLMHGCNAFDGVNPTSNPMSFWTEQDVLHYIKKFNLPICSVYGDVVPTDAVWGDDGEIQYTIFDTNNDYEGTELRTTLCDRTGCVFCGFGCHLEKESRFERLKITHPKLYDYLMRSKEEGGLDYKTIIDWLNENGNLNIRY